MYRYRFEYIKDETKRDDIKAEHKALLDSILSGDVAAAKEASNVHIDNQEKAILRRIYMDQKAR